MLVFIQRVRRIAIVFLSTALAVISLVGVPAGAAGTGTGTLTGTVTNASNLGIGGVCVEVQIDNAGIGIGTYATATTASNGSYTLSGLPAGKYYLDFDPSCSGTVTSTYEWQSIAEPVIVSASGSATQNATLGTGAGTITGTVTNASNVGIGGVSVFVTGGGGGGGYNSATTASNGSYTLSGLPAGTYTVGFYPSSSGTVTSPYAPESIAEPVIVSASGSTTQNATLALGGTITGTVTNASNVGIGGVCVWVRGSGSDLTASNGSYTITGLPAGTYTVEFSTWLPLNLPVGASDSTDNPMCPGTVTSNYTPQSIGSVIVSAGGSTTQNAMLDTGVGIITGTVTNTSNVEVGGVCVSVEIGNTRYGSGVTARNGSYHLFGLAAGTYTVSFDPTCNDLPYVSQSIKSVIVSASGSTTQNATLVLGGDITGTVTNTSKVGIGGVCVSVEIRGTRYRSVTWASNGAYIIRIIQALTTGTYTVSFDPTCDGTVTSTYTRRTIGVTVTAGRTTTQNATLATLARSATLNVGFAARRSSLGLTQERALTALAKKLVAGASVVITGYAKANTALARSRARAVAKFLSSRVRFKIHVTLKTSTTTAASKVTVLTARP